MATPYRWPPRVSPSLLEVVRIDIDVNLSVPEEPADREVNAAARARPVRVKHNAGSPGWDVLREKAAADLHDRFDLVTLRVRHSYSIPLDGGTTNIDLSLLLHADFAREGRGVSAPTTRKRVNVRVKGH